MSPSEKWVDKNPQHLPNETLVGLFLAKIGHKLPEKPDPVLMTPGMRVTWANIFLEEALELIDGLGVQVTNDGPVVIDSTKQLTFDVVEPLDMVELADGIADSVYVAQAIAILCGIQLDPILREVCQNNLNKFGPGHSFKDGKLIKPPGHLKPNIEGELKKQGYGL